MEQFRNIKRKVTTETEAEILERTKSTCSSALPDPLSRTFNLRAGGVGILIKSCFCDALKEKPLGQSLIREKVRRTGRFDFWSQK